MTPRHVLAACLVGLLSVWALVHYPGHVLAVCAMILAAAFALGGADAVHARRRARRARLGVGRRHVSR